MSSSTLLQLFKVRLCNFKASSVNTRGTAPFCVRGNFDGKPFHTEYFHGQSMAPMWALDIKFDYHAPNIDVLVAKYLLLEVYGSDVFLGMSRIDLLALASGPSSVELTVRDGLRVNGTLTFDCFIEQVTNVTFQLTRAALGHLANRGQETNPSPYLAYGFQETGPTLESAVSPNAVSPEWERLPPLHKRVSYPSLTDTRLFLEVKHSRNGFSPSITDPVMATFEISLATLPVEIGRDSVLPIREMVHSLPAYPFPFSTMFTAVLELRNAPRIAQMRSGLLTENGVVGGVSAQASFASSSIMPPIQPPLQAAASSPSRYRSPPRMPSAPRGPGALPPPAPQPESIDISTRAGDIEVLEGVADKHSVLLAKTQQRLQDVSRRRAEVAQQISTLKSREEQVTEATARRRAGLEADLRTALAERERLEDAIRSVTLRREEEVRIASLQATERERMRRALEEEQQEVAALQGRVLQLRSEMARHLEEEEQRYLQRLKEADEARRRAQQDADDLALLEARLTQAESRAQQRHREEESKMASRVQRTAAYGSPSRPT